MNVALWIVQVVLAAVFAFSGTQKATRSKEALIASGQTGVAPFSLPVIRFTAISELAAAIGLIVPWAADIAPVLTPLAAVGLAIIMVVAMWVHARRHETKNVAVNVVIFAMCVFVAIERLADLH
jgi:uncharacterized membrane protein YphA (DoxX/SURF4 family)